jgi:tetratricopeptide (TPR) repeat protein
MERIDGQPIDEALRAHDWRSIVERLAQVCRALSYVHSRRIVHFDLKPANILLDVRGAAKVVDFGIAAGPMAHGDRIMGTPLYMPPELLLSEGNADHRADLYSLGITLYELLFGEPPCKARNLVDIAAWLSEGGVHVAPSATVPEWLARLVATMCARDPADRPRHANAIIQALNASGGFAYQLETRETRQSYVTTPRFCGRTKEQSRILSFLSQRLSGKGAEPALLVSGVSGIGKSRLMKEVRHAAQLQRHVFIEANCYERSLVEYGPIADVLYQLVPLIETLGGIDIVHEALPALVKMAPRLSHGRSVEELPKAMTADGERALLLQMSTEFLLKASRLVPFAVYINDMQWAERGPAELFSYIARRISDDQSQGQRIRVALIGSYRSDEVESRPLETMLRAIHSRRLSADIELSALASEQLGDIIRSMLGVENIPGEFLERLSTETAGNPFFVQEVMRVLFENGSVFLEEGKWATKVEIGELQIPPTMAEVFRRRFHLLGDQEKDVVRALAVHGQPLQVERIADVLESGEVMTALLELEEKTIVAKQVGRALSYNIAHDRMRETIYGDLEEGQRQTWHRRIAEKLEALASRLPDADRPLDELARHYRGAKVPDKALSYSISAGKRALDLFSNASADEHLASALALMGEHDARHPQIAEAHADAQQRLGKFDEALQSLEALLQFCGNEAARARVYQKISVIYLETTRVEEARDAAWRAMQLLGEPRPNGALAWIWRTVFELTLFSLVRLGVPGLTRLRKNAHLLAEIYYQLLLVYIIASPLAVFYTALRGWRLTARSPSAEERTLHEGVLAFALGIAGFRSTAYRLAEHAIAEADRAGAWRSLGGTLGRYELVAFSEGQHRANRDRVGRVIQLSHKTGDHFMEATAVGLLWGKLFWSGDVAGAHQCVAKHNLEAFRLTDAPTTSLLTLAAEAFCVSVRSPSEHARVDAMLAQATDHALRGRDVLIQTVIGTFCASVLLMRGATLEAIDKLQAILALRRERRDITAYGAQSYCLLPRAYLRLPRLTEGQARSLAQTHKQARRVTRLHPVWRSQMLVNEALLRERRAEPDKADRYFAEAIAVAKQQSAGWFVADALYEWGKVLTDRREPERAIACLGEARDIAENGGNVFEQQRCDALLADIAGG